MNSPNAKTTEYRNQVAAVAADIATLAAVLGQPLAVRAEHAGLVWAVEQAGGVVDLFTGDIHWQPARRWSAPHGSGEVAA